MYQHPHPQTPNASFGSFNNSTFSLLRTREFRLPTTEQIYPGITVKGIEFSYRISQ
jgi:hypothetical protein